MTIPHGTGTLPVPCGTGSAVPCGTGSDMGPKLNYMVPKLKYFAHIQNDGNLVPLKTSRFVRGKLPTLPACHPPTPSESSSSDFFVCLLV